MAEVATAPARAYLWAVLAQGFSYPRADRLALLAEGTGDLAIACDTLGLSGADEVIAAVAAAPPRLGVLQGLYNRLFVTGLEVPIAETSYELDKTARRAAELADIQGFHRAFGLRLGAPIEPDHLVAELDFLSALAQKIAHFEAAGAPDALEVVEHAYRAFLEDHLGRWYEIFCDRLEQATEDAFYRCLGRLLREWVEAELRRLDLAPMRLTRYMGDAAAASAWPCGAGPGAAAG